MLCVIYTGGLGFSTDQIGTALLCVAGPMLVLQLWLYPKVNVQALVTWRMDIAIHWVNLYPVDSSAGGVVNSYVLNSISIFRKTRQKCLFITVIGYTHGFETHELLHMCIDLLFFFDFFLLAWKASWINQGNASCFNVMFAFVWLFTKYQTCFHK